MKNLSFRKFLFSVLILSMAVSVCEAQSFRRSAPRHHSRGMMRKTPGRPKKTRIREPRSVEKARRVQEAKKKQQDKDYAEFVKENRAHAVEIQTPEVQARMLQNRKDADAAYKAKKKRVNSGSKKAGKKYR